MAIKTPKAPRVKRKEKKAAAMYEKNPVWKEEDAQGPIPGYKKGGSIRPATDKANRGLFKTGGMVNANSKITAIKKATGKVGGITKAISKAIVKATSPKGTVGGTSKAPKDASPTKLAKAKMGGMKGKSC